MPTPTPTLTLKLKIPGKSAERTPEGVTYERQYVGQTDIPSTEGAVEALTGSATPDHIALADKHPDNSIAVCISVKVEAQGDSRTLWNVVAKFQEPRIGGSIPDNPMQRRPDVRWGSDYETRSILVDYAEPFPNIITASSGERFPELPQREFGDLTVQYTRNEEHPDWEVIREGNVCVNSAPFTIDGQVIPARYALLTIPEAPKIYEGVYTYYRVTYVIRLRDRGWVPQYYLDVGYNELDIVNGQPVLKPIVDADGMPVRTPYPLDGTGRKMPNPTDPPAQLPFYPFRQIDFSVFRFE